MYIVCQVKNVRYIVVETYFIGRTIGVNCEQMMEFASSQKFWSSYIYIFIADTQDAGLKIYNEAES